MPTVVNYYDCRMLIPRSMYQCIFLCLSGYKLRYKRDFGGWEEVSVDASQDYIVLKNLHCGTRYQMTLLAVNNIGHGDPSETITVATMGSGNKTFNFSIPYK